MRSIKGFLVAMALLAGGTVWFSCENEGVENEGASHNTGNNCLVCHKSGGDGEGVFTAGGTVYKTGTTTGISGVSVKLFSNADGTGTPVATLTSDNAGNFYSKSSINFGTGLYVKVTSSNGTSSMASSITSGACNGCHGIVTDKVFVQ
jgi:hypothetical protein